MNYHWQDLSDSELRTRLVRQLKRGSAAMRLSPYSAANVDNLVRQRDDDHAAELIDRIFDNIS